MQETWVWSLGWEDPLEKEMATHSSIAWRIPWTERGAWQTSAHGVTRVKHDLATKPPPQSWNTGHRSYLMFWERPNKWLRTPLGPRRQAASLDCKPLPFKPRTAERKALCFSVAQSHLTLCDPLDCSPPGSSVHGIFQARTREWVAISSSRGVFLTQGSNLHLLHWQADSLPLSHQGSSRESPNVNENGILFPINLLAILLPQQSPIPSTMAYLLSQSALTAIPHCHVPLMSRSLLWDTCSYQQALWLGTHRDGLPSQQEVNLFLF